MRCNALRRLIEASDDSAMVVFILSFSASRLKGLLLPLPLFLSFLDFEAVDEGVNRLLPKPELLDLDL